MSASIDAPAALALIADLYRQLTDTQARLAQAIAELEQERATRVPPDPSAVLTTGTGAEHGTDGLAPDTSLTTA